MQAAVDRLAEADHHHHHPLHHHRHHDAAVAPIGLHAASILVTSAQATRCWALAGGLVGYGCSHQPDVQEPSAARQAVQGLMLLPYLCIVH